MQDVTLIWKGDEFKVDAREVLPLIAKIEEHLTLMELIESANRGTAPMAKLAMAYGVALRYAGARATNDEVYSAMFSGNAKQAATDAINTLLTLMVPPEHLQEKGGGSKKAEAVTPAANSSKRRTKRASHGG